jgi:protein involved in polysaccharide export with SLBB domain
LYLCALAVFCPAVLAQSAENAAAQAAADCEAALGAADATNGASAAELGVASLRVIQLPPAQGLSMVSPTSLADWQKRLTLGPGDVLNVSLYEQPKTLRAGVTIGPDGRLSYLEARQVTAAGLTVDELRDQLEQILFKHHPPPVRVIVQPQSYRSKKFYLLGNLRHPGVYTLDRPMTVVEAIAAAGGFAKPLPRGNSVQVFERSFLLRKDESNRYARVALDFQALFLRGDLAQNVALAPDDYLHLE